MIIIFGFLRYHDCDAFAKMVSHRPFSAVHVWFSSQFSHLEAALNHYFDITRFDLI